MRKSCNKTHFCMICAVWQLFPRFLVVFVMKGALGKGLEMPRTSYCMLVG